MQPKLRTEAIVWRKNGELIRFLVQCDDEESFYRFPGGTVEFGETTDAALQREFNEEYDLDIQVGNLKVVSEEYVTYEGKTHHRVTMLHEAQITGHTDAEIRHKEYTNIKMTWRTIEQLGTRDVAPTGIFEHLKNFLDIPIAHLRYGFN